MLDNLNGLILNACSAITRKLDTSVSKVSNRFPGSVGDPQRPSAIDGHGICSATAPSTLLLDSFCEIDLEHSECVCEELAYAPFLIVHRELKRDRNACEKFSHAFLSLRT